MDAPRFFWQHYSHIKRILLDCQNIFYVTKNDKEDIKKESPLERGHLKYLMIGDPEIEALRMNGSAAVFFDKVEYSFGLIQSGTDATSDTQVNITEFKAHKGSDAIFVMFIGVVNHWVSLICYKKDLNKMTEE